MLQAGLSRCRCVCVCVSSPFCMQTPSPSCMWCFLFHSIIQEGGVLYIFNHDDGAGVHVKKTAKILLGFRNILVLGCP